MLLFLKHEKAPPPFFALYISEDGQQERAVLLSRLGKEYPLPHQGKDDLVSITNQTA
jgi:hypothetical protein